MMRSALRIVARRCAITRPVRPFSSTASAFWMSCSVWLSMLAVASSRTRIGASATSARAKLTSWRWPIDRLLPRSVSSVS
jgi:hypothetical protein